MQQVFGTSDGERWKAGLGAAPKRKTKRIPRSTQCAAHQDEHRTVSRSVTLGKKPSAVSTNLKEEVNNKDRWGTNVLDRILRRGAHGSVGAAG